jgi:hypothetical protein
MSHANRLKGHFYLTLLLIFCVMSAGQARPHRFNGRKEFLPYTRNLPAIDRVELLKLTLKDDGRNGEHWNGETDATKVLRGTEAQKVASLWRNQTYTPNVSACHEPAYAIKFYAKEKLLAYATVCWSCNNIRFITPELNGEQNFAGGDKKGEQLSEVFRLAFIETRSAR